jgi:predicted transcriptional regulator
VREIMNERPDAVYANTSVSQVVDLLCGKGIYGVPMMSGHHLLGMIKREEVIDRFLKDIKGRFLASDVMSYNTATCCIYDPVEKLIKRFCSGGDRRVVVMNNNAVAGTVTFQDMINILLADNAEISTLSVSDVLVPLQASISKNDDAARAGELMLEWGVSAIPVVNGGLEGIIRDKDILQRIHALM